jgi:pimeloyl-ACP methyl ester carboxylesterase
MERIVQANDVDICTEPFGDPADPPILLVMGTGASMLWWDEGFCRLLAGRGRFVIRYDHRDTGRSTTYEPGRPRYTGSDLVADAAAVIDGYGVAPAHVVGVSAGGGIAQQLALGFADHVRSLVLISTSPAVSVGGELPSPTESFMQFVTTAQADWSDAASVIEYLVDYSRVLAGGARPFDEAPMRALITSDVQRAHDFPAMQNHDVLPEGEPPRAPLSSISVPTLVIHGDADPMFPLPHGEALADAIPGAKLLPLKGAGHGVEQADWPIIVRAIAEHTT